MSRYNLNEAIDRLERSFVTGEIKIATGKVWKDKDFLRRIISERKLPVGHGAANAAGLIQGQTELHASSCGLPACGGPDRPACFGGTAKFKDGGLVLIGLLELRRSTNMS